MAIFDFNKKRIGKTEFTKDPEAFIRFLRENDEDLAGFGQGALIAAGTEVINPLLKILTNRNEDIKVRRRAGNVLAKIGKSSVIPLLEALKKQNMKSKTSAETVGLIAAALGGTGKEALEPLIHALGSVQFQVRFGAAVALVQSGDAQAISAVREAAIHGYTGDFEMFRMILGKNW